MDNIKIIVVWLIVCGVLLFGVQHYKGKAEKLQHQMTVAETQSKQIVHDKQVEVDKTHDRANEYLKKAKEEYEKKIAAFNASNKSGSVSKRTTNANGSNRVSRIQEPTSILETKIEYKEKAVEDTACELKYKELWDTWEGLCLIYGCTD